MQCRRIYLWGLYKRGTWMILKFTFLNKLNEFIIMDTIVKKTIQATLRKKKYFLHPPLLAKSCVVTPNIWRHQWWGHFRSWTKRQWVPVHQIRHRWRWYPVPRPRLVRTLEEWLCWLGTLWENDLGSQAIGTIHEHGRDSEQSGSCHCGVHTQGEIGRRDQHLQHDRSISTD